MALISQYDPFARGSFPAGVCTIHANDDARKRVFPCEIWYPAAAQHTGADLAADTQDSFTDPFGVSRRQMAVRDAAALPGRYPLVIYSHSSGGHRRSATFLCTHLASHGYVVAALDHSELVAPELARKEGESEEQKWARARVWAANRVPDITFILDHLLSGAAWHSEAKIDSQRIGIAGHSFGGWTALAMPESEQRIRAIVVHAPAGASNPRPGIIPAKLTFHWKCNVPTLYLVAENDVALPLAGMYELFERTQSTRQMILLRHADHMHFMDNVEEIHEGMRTMKVGPELAAMQQEMLPFAELCSEEKAHLFLRGLTLCHLDAVLRQMKDAQQFLAGDLQSALDSRGIDATVISTPRSADPCEMGASSPNCAQPS